MEKHDEEIKDTPDDGRKVEAREKMAAAIEAWMETPLTIEEWLELSDQFVKVCEKYGVPLPGYHLGEEALDEKTKLRMFEELLPSCDTDWIYNECCTPVEADTPDEGVYSIIEEIEYYWDKWNDSHKCPTSDAEDYLHAFRTVKRALILGLDPRKIKHGCVVLQRNCPGWGWPNMVWKKLDWQQIVEDKWAEYIKEVVGNAIAAGAYTIKEYDDCHKCEVTVDGARQLTTKCSVLKAAGYEVARFHSRKYMLGGEPDSDISLDCEVYGAGNIPGRVWQEMGGVRCPKCCCQPVYPDHNYCLGCERKEKK